MSNRVTLAQLGETPPEEAARLPAEQLAMLVEDLAERQAETKRIADHLHAVLSARYGERAAEARRAAGKDTGAVRLEDDGFAVSADLPKRAAWDQAKLAEAVATLREWGENPLDYVDLDVKVSEARYAAWPPAVRDLFTPARTVAAGRPTFKIERKKTR